MKRTALILLGPALILLAFTALPFSPAQNAAIGTAAWMVAWWSTQVLPIGVTSLLPLILFPAFGVVEIGDTALNYAHPVIFLFLGGFVLGLAIEKWDIHKRLALNILRVSGERPTQVIAGFMAATAFLSMWISNTAAAVMMLPIGISVIGLLEGQFSDKGLKNRFAVSLLLGLAFAANIGGTATIIGTPPNLVLAGILSEEVGYEIGFGQWIIFALPFAAVLFLVVLFVNTRLLFRVPSFTMYGMRHMVTERLKTMGNMSAGEKRVAVVFGSTALLWVARAPLAELPGLDFLSDPLIGMAGAVTMFVVTDPRKKPLMTWKDMKRMPWDILLLFGGGLSIAAG
ncbi:MAG: SLC13 family permease, partial [Cryomorphaceae bacterium]